MTVKRPATFVATACLAGVLAACGAAEAPPTPVVISGTINVPDGVPTDGKVTVNLYHAWALDGDLRHPIEEIESFEATAGAYRHAFAYPSDRGEGLLIYAWLDVDGDGALCSPTVRIDRAGLTEVRGFPAAEVTADIDLAVPCAAPNWFYPPASAD
ncbi:MAG: hypothetical protein E2O52_08445 [Gammaproteobacteria bacterium]|nr:MAG: hypothetical protein E2O52_08445 [Gammaproteobacteria bacterium]